MKKYYKYMKLREEFFDNLLIRASQPEALDGHFECIMTPSQIKRINEHQDNFFLEKGTPREILSDYEADEFLGDWQQEFAAKGIISLTKNNSNIAMWQHYADSYQGICIELEIEKSILSDTKHDTQLRFKDSVLGSYHEIPYEIHYSDSIPDFAEQEDAVPDSKYEYPHKNIVKKITSCKPSDLRFEEEFRILLELQNADKVIFYIEEKMLNQLEKICIKDSQIKFDIIKEDKKSKEVKCEITYPPRFELDEEVGDESIRFEILQLTDYWFNASPIFLYKLNPKIIKTIYFGHRVCPMKYKRAIEKIKNNKALEHVKIKKAQPSYTDFKVEFSEDTR